MTTREKHEHIAWIVGTVAVLLALVLTPGCANSPGNPKPKWKAYSLDIKE